MSSSTEIANLALSHLGSGKRIADIDTDKSSEADAARIFYDITRKQTLRDFCWPVARRFVTLGLVQEDPIDEWAYSYRYPADALEARRILNASVRNESRQDRIPFIITSDSVGKLIYTDYEDACLEYTIDLKDTSIWTPDMIMAMSYLLAARMAPVVTGEDPFQLSNRAIAYYQAEIREAKGKARNEQQDEEVPQSEFIRARR